MPAATKNCLICGQDCSNRPRVKDPQGRYSCKACLEKARATRGPKAPPAPTVAKPATPRAAAPSHDDDAGVMSGLIEDTLKQQGPPCAACGSPMMHDQVICVRCGFNTSAGKGISTSVVSAAPTRSETAGKIAGAAATVLIQANPLAWLGAAAASGAVAAGIWYFIAMQTDREFSFIALGVGIFVGLCVKLTAGNYAGAVSGGMAVAAAIAAIVAGKYLVFANVVGDFERQVNIRQVFNFNDTQLTGLIAREIAQFEESGGREIVWPDGVDSESAMDAEDFPRDIWAKAEGRWKAASEEWRRQYKQDKEADLKADYESAKAQGFVEWAFLNKSALFILGAIAAALWVGSGGEVAGAVPSKSDD